MATMPTTSQVMDEARAALPTGRRWASAVWGGATVLLGTLSLVVLGASGMWRIFAPTPGHDQLMRPVVGVSAPAPWRQWHQWQPVAGAQTDAVQAVAVAGAANQGGPRRFRPAPPAPAIPFIPAPGNPLFDANAPQIARYARLYRIDPQLALLVYRSAVEQRIDPELAFRLVRLESEFVPSAVSAAGAIGLTQLMLGTARYFQPGITEDDLLDPRTNLRIGFAYLRELIGEFNGDLRLALLTYNRGPVAVYAAINSGLNPDNGYERILLRGYAGRGVID